MQVSPQNSPAPLAPKKAKTQEYRFVKSAIGYSLGYGQGDIADLPNAAIDAKMLARLQRDGVIIPYVPSAQDDEE